LRLPRAQTVFFFPVGPLEDHGPHLPLGLDLIEATALCRLAAERLEREMPGWNAVLMPAAPLGIDSNTRQLALTVRAHVLRDWLVDACKGLTRAGFCHFACFSGHLGPKQLTAIEEAGGLIRKRTRWIRLSRRLMGARATALPPLPTLFSVCSAQVTSATVRESPLFLDAREHGGRRDTSVALTLEPALVDPSQATLEARPWASPARWKRSWLRLTRQISGYWGKPAEGSAAWGQGVLQGTIDEVFPKIRAVLEGADPNHLFRSWYSIVPSNRSFFVSWLLALIFAGFLLMWVFVNLASIVNGN
jgi:creatinine amidohydrolase